MKIKPMGDRIALKRIDNVEQVTPSGIVIPEPTKVPTTAEVIAVGPGKMVKGKRIPIDVEVGDIVVTGAWGMEDFKIDGETYVIAPSIFVLGKLSRN